MTLLIDANIFLELFLGRERADECERLLDKIARGEQGAVVTKFTVHSIEAILNKSELILTFLRNIMNSIGLQVYDSTLDDEMAVAMLIPKVELSFDDAVQYYVAKKLGVDAIVSFDRHFEELDIPRREPRALINT